MVASNRSRIFSWRKVEVRDWKNGSLEITQPAPKEGKKPQDYCDKLAADWPSLTDLNLNGARCGDAAVKALAAAPFADRLVSLWLVLAWPLHDLAGCGRTGSW